MTTDHAAQLHKVHAVISTNTVLRGFPPGQTTTKLVLLSGQDNAQDNGAWLTDEGPWERPDTATWGADFAEHTGGVYMASRPREEKHYRMIGLHPVGVWAEWARLDPKRPRQVHWHLAEHPINANDLANAAVEPS